ncbi:MAG: hypothetical protein FJZ96_04550 [Chloroflexi bacterium]|nr:hypothetical protein [Chloroflexota bacterium]
MKRTILSLTCLALVILACSFPPTATPTLPPPATEPPAGTESPVETVPPVPITNVTCNVLSLYLDPALASSYSCQIVPESAGEFEVYPTYTELTLVGYPLADKFFTPHISVYPIERYSELLPDLVPGRYMGLINLIALGVPPFVASFTTSIPFLPNFNAAQVFYAREAVLPFGSGNGIRFMTEYAQYFAPVNNHDLFYTYQGATSDMLYWVSVILPINHPTLPANADNPPGGMTWEDFSNNYEPYITGMVSQLNMEAPDSYTPSITALDALVNSIVITP